jgi:two-component system cell cycle response regulator
MEKDSLELIKPSILIVDDNEEILDFLEADLGDHYQVFKAHHGLEALKILQEESIQLVVSDVMMPEMDGFELCKKIKSNFESCHIGVILLTAKNTLQSKIEGLELGADAYIEKPFSPRHLQAQISALMMNKNKLKDFYAQSPLAHMKSLAYNKADEQFLESLNNAINAHIEESDLDVDHIARYLNMSRPTLYRKIKGVSNLSPSELIHVARLKKAAELFSEGNTRISEVAMMVGYTSAHHFARNFQKQFGMTPSEYLKRDS